MTTTPCPACTAQFDEDWPLCNDPACPTWRTLCRAQSNTCESCGLVLSECICSVGGNQDSTPVELAAYRREHGLDQPVGNAEHFWNELWANLSPEEVKMLRELGQAYGRGPFGLVRESRGQS